MSILTDKPQNCIVVDGVECEIYTDFRKWIRFGDIMEDERRDFFQRFIEAVSLCIDVTKPLPDSAQGLLAALCEFYGGSRTKIASHKADKQGTQIYSFEYDADYIYAAFLAEYSIDLSNIEYLHWHNFLALFKGLSDEHKISKIMMYRSVDISKIKDKEQKSFYRKMKRLYAIPDNRTEEERAQDIANMVDCFV